jgi:hypothetical protein
MKGLLVGLSFLLFAVACGGRSAATPPSSHSLYGALTLITAGGFVGPGESCSGLDGFDDITAGAEVSVKDETGKVVAVGNLGAGSRESIVICSFSFTVNNVPVAKFYTVEITHRGGITYSYADLVSKGWHITVSLSD